MHRRGEVTAPDRVDPSVTGSSPVRPTMKSRLITPTEPGTRSAELVVPVPADNTFAGVTLSRTAALGTLPDQSITPSDPSDKLAP